MQPLADPPQVPASGETADRADLQAVARGERAALERLYRRHVPRLCAFLQRHCGRADLVEDAVNKTMWAVWTQAARFRGDSLVSTWITGIAYRSLLKLLRDTGAPLERNETQLSEAELAERDAGEPAEAPHDMLELRDWLAKGLHQLPEDQRRTLELAYFGGLSCLEIAALMGCAEGTVKARLFHARVRLRSLMPQIGGGR
jgi:RNA polymerase sigma-70 factor (ECF subfamily)